MDNKKRWKSIDCLRGISCIAVVFIHYNFPNDPGIAVKTFFRFGVPVFFIVSGFFLLSNGTVSDTKIVKKIKHILKITFFASIFYAIFTIIWNPLISSDWNMKVFAVERLHASKIVKFFITNDPFVYSHLWFLLALIYCYVFSILFLTNNKNLKYVKFLAPVLLICYSCMQEFGNITPFRNSFAIPGTTDRLYLYNLFLFRALPFFLFGILLRQYQEKISNLKIPDWILTIVMLCGGFISIYERFHFTEAQFYIGTYLTVAAMFILAIKKPDAGGNILEYIGRELSLYVYILHIAVGKIFDLIAQKNHLWGNDVFTYSKCFLVLLSSLLIAFVVSTFVNKWKLRYSK